MTKTVWRAKTKIQTQFLNSKSKKISNYHSASRKILVSIFNSFAKVFKFINSVYVHKYKQHTKCSDLSKRSHLCPLQEKSLGLKETRPNWTRQIREMKLALLAKGWAYIGSLLCYFFVETFCLCYFLSFLQLYLADLKRRFVAVRWGMILQNKRMPFWSKASIMTSLVVNYLLASVDNIQWR